MDDWAATVEFRFARYRKADGQLVSVLQQKYTSGWAPFEVWVNVPVVTVEEDPRITGRRGDEE